MRFDCKRKFNFEIGDVLLSPCMAGGFGGVEQADGAGAEGDGVGGGAAVRRYPIWWMTRAGSAPMVTLV